MKRILFILPVLVCQYFGAVAQEDYEIQVYASKTVEKHRTMVEIHSNHVLSGGAPFNETIEITHGFTNYFEVGLYLFNQLANDGEYSFSGSHIRARVAVPEKWKWPFGAGLSVEYGKTNEWFGDYTTLEIRPIIDKKWKKNYFALNPVLGRTFDGYRQPQGYILSPNIKWSHDMTKKVALGVEYYGTSGAIPKLSVLQGQQYELYGAIDLDINPNWEFNAGLGIAGNATKPTTIAKVIVGHRF